MLTGRIQRRFGILQVWRVEVFGEAAAERGKWVLGLLRLVLTARPYHPDMEEVRESIRLEGATRSRPATSAACAVARSSTGTSAGKRPGRSPGPCESGSSSPTSAATGPSLWSRCGRRGSLAPFDLELPHLRLEDRYIGLRVGRRVIT